MPEDMGNIVPDIMDGQQNYPPAIAGFVDRYCRYRSVALKYLNDPVH